jgi:hypothetical protein
MEATEPPETVLQYYDQLLDADSANAVCSSLHLHFALSCKLIAHAIGYLEKKDISFATNG